MDAQVNIENKYSDPIRHAYTSANLATELKDDISNLPYVGGALSALGLDTAGGFVGANTMGIGHEDQVFERDDRPFFTKLKESGQDIYNNILGSYIGLTSDTKEDAYDTILKTAEQGDFAKGFVKRTGGDLTKYQSLGEFGAPTQGTLQPTFSGYSLSRKSNLPFFASSPTLNNPAGF